MAEPIDLGELFNFENLERDEKLIFVLLPFKDKYFEIFNNIIKPVVKEKDLTCLKADDPATNNVIIKDILDNIYKSRFVIADITERNSNVLYEIGVADFISREVIMINDRLEKEKQDYPFDVSYRRIINYDNKIAESENFKKKLGDTLDYVLVNTANPTREPETQNIESEKINQLIWQSDLQYRLRARRIEWFTYHPIHFFARFAKFHMDRLKELYTLHFDFSHEKFDIIKKRWNIAYCQPSHHYASHIITSSSNTHNPSTT